MTRRLIFDSHTHFHDEMYGGATTIEKMLTEAKENNVGYFCDVAYDLESSKQCIKLANLKENIFATVGIHPNSVQDYQKEVLIEINELAQNNKVVAVGEVGLDYYYSKEHKDLQKYFFREQIKIAKNNNIALMMHIRDEKNIFEAYDDVLEILKEIPIERKIVHCFSANSEYALKFLEMGCYINIGGAVTFKNAKDLQEAAKVIPIEKMMVETDSPYLTPHPFRGQMNTPKNIKYTIEKIAELKELPIDEVIKNTTKNAFKVFEIKEN